MGPRQSLTTAAVVAGCVVSSLVATHAVQRTAVKIDQDDIGGVVTSRNGAEAGVWVIAETTDLPTKYAKIVVTDDKGRYVLPDLPTATYDVWVRGYGLVDSATVKAAPGKQLDLSAAVAPDAKAAAQYYPANYWFALVQPPPKSDFPGTGLQGNGIPETTRTQAEWIGNIKMTNACTQCHQMGTKFTREIQPQLGTFKTAYDAWDYRIGVGISGPNMASKLAPLGRKRALQVFADWTTRIAAGELPQVPPRPTGRERDVVLTLWDWADAKTFVHDEISTDKRHPTVNANGLVFGTQEVSADFLAVLDPVKNTTSRIPVPLINPNAPRGWNDTVQTASPYWGDEVVWYGKVVPHNAMFDAKGRLWISGRGGCEMYDPASRQFTVLPSCPLGHHVQIDEHDVAWADGGGVGYLDLSVWDKTKDLAKASGHIAVVIDVNGNGKLDEAVPPTAPMDPDKDRELNLGQAYAVMPNPVDGTVWVSYSVIPGYFVRIDPKTKLSEVYQPPFNNPKAPIEGYEPHGIDVDRSGVIWAALNSGHLASFDRRKCKAPYNPKAEPLGQQCTEGWTLVQSPGPNFKGVTASGSADSFYLNWVDQFDTLGLGKDVPLVNGSGSDSIMALVNGKWIVLRVPYPMGFHSRGMDGRIDDPKTGWKGKGIWSTYAAQATWHIEGGKGTTPKVVHLQLRPDPLAH